MYTARRRTTEEVKRMMAPAESVEAAIDRVSHQGGGGAKHDEHDDDDFVIDNTVVSLMDPLGGMRITTPAR